MLRQAAKRALGRLAQADAGLVSWLDCMPRRPSCRPHAHHLLCCRCISTRMQWQAAICGSSGRCDASRHHAGGRTLTLAPAVSDSAATAHRCLPRATRSSASTWAPPILAWPSWRGRSAWLAGNSLLCASAKPRQPGLPPLAAGCRHRQLPPAAAVDFFLPFLQTPKVIENAEGQRTTPSVVAFTDKGERLVIGEAEVAVPA